MLLNFTALKPSLPLSADAIIYLNSPSCVGMRGMMAQKKTYKPKPYDTPSRMGVKWQMDVKYVPTACYTGSVPQKFYKYTIIDEASQQRFLYPYMEQLQAA